MQYSQRALKKYRMCVKPQRIIMSPSNPLRDRIKKYWLKKAEYLFDLNNQPIRIGYLLGRIIWLLLED